MSLSQDLKGGICYGDCDNKSGQALDRQLPQKLQCRNCEAPGPWLPLLENWLGVSQRAVAVSEWSIVALVISSKLEKNANVGF